MPKIMIYERLTPDHDVVFKGEHFGMEPTGPGVNSVRVGRLHFRVRHYPSGDQVWIHQGAVPEKFWLIGAEKESQAPVPTSGAVPASVPAAAPMSHEDCGSGYDRDARGHETVGRAPAPKTKSKSKTSK